jgi:hypothetical protein
MVGLRPDMIATKQRGRISPDKIARARYIDSLEIKRAWRADLRYFAGIPNTACKRSSDPSSH